MKTSINKLSQSSIELEIELSIEEFNDFYNKTVGELGKNIEIKGYRKGKAPKEVLEKEIGLERILREAAQKAVQESFQKAVLENKIDVIGPPEISILKLAPNNPFIFKAKTPILPEVVVPDYRKIASEVKQRKVEVTEKEIEMLKAEKERVEKERLRQELIERIVEKAKIEIPKILIDQEKNHMLSNFKKQIPFTLGVNFEEYLKKIGKTEEEIYNDFEKEAEKRVRAFLVLKAIAEKEAIKVPEEEIKKKTDELTRQHPEIQKELVETGKIKTYVESLLRNEKVFQILESLVKKEN